MSKFQKLVEDVYTAFEFIGGNQSRITYEHLIRNAERQEIIKRIEKEMPCLLKGSHHSFGMCSCLAIALVKDEVEDE